MGTVTVTGMASGLPAGQFTIGPLTTTGTNPAAGGILPGALASGDNTFAVPAGVVKAVICLGTAPAVTVKLRTNLNSGDAGTPIAPYAGIGFTVVDLPAGVTSLILNSSGALAGIELTFI